MSQLVGTRLLLGLALRLDRVRLPIWLGSISGMMALQVAGIVAMYPSEEEMASYAAVTASSAAARMFGAIDGPTLGSVLMVEMWAIQSVLASLMGIFLVVRHTRLSEQEGRLELVGSTPVGRHASLVAALVLALGAYLVLGALLLGVMVGMGVPAAGSALMVAGIVGSGMVFAAAAAVVAQVTASARIASGGAVMLLGAAFVVRAIGDVRGQLDAAGMAIRIDWPSWLGPLGWGQLAYPFSEQRAWALLPYPLVVSLLVAVAITLSARRDVGQGMLGHRHRPTRAGRLLSSPLGLAVRLHRGQVLGWGVGIALLGSFIGSFAGELGVLLEENPALMEVVAAMGGSDVMEDAYYAYMIGFVGLLTGAMALQVVLRMRSEELGPLESVLATAASRTTWLASHVMVAVAATAAVLVLASLGTSVAAILVGEPARWGDLLAAHLVQLPAVLVLVGAAVAAFGVGSRYGPLAGWSLLALSALVFIGEMLQLPDALLQASPFTHLPLLPAEDLAWGPVLALAGIGASGLAAGAAAFRRRNVGA